MHNTDKRIRSFAHSCFKFAIDTKHDLWFATKDTISKTYDAQFRKIFEEVYESDYKEKFAELGIEYFYTLIEDAVDVYKRQLIDFLRNLHSHIILYDQSYFLRRN